MERRRKMEEVWRGMESHGGKGRELRERVMNRGKRESIEGKTSIGGKDGGVEGKI